jgi:hypothetical protein
MQKPGAIAHLWFEGKCLLILRDKLRPGEKPFAYPNCWDPVSETPEDEDQGDFKKTIVRGLEEEIGLAPQFLVGLGLTRQNRNGFFVGYTTKEEMGRFYLGHEGRKMYWFTLDKVWAMEPRLGGGIKFHLKAYRKAFEMMAMGLIPSRKELGLSPYPSRVPILTAA